MAPTKNTRAVLKQAAALSQPPARKALTRRSAQNIQDQNMDITQTRAKRKADHHSPIKNEKAKRSALGNLTNNVKLNTQILAEPHDAKQQNHQQHQQILTKKKISHNFGNYQQQQEAAENKNAVDDTVSAGAAVVHQQTQAKNMVMTRATAARIFTNVKLSTEQPPASKMCAPISKTAASNNASIGKAKKSEELSSAISAPPQPPPPAVPLAPAAASIPILMKATHKPVRRISNEFNKTEESLYMSALEDVSSCESMRLSGNFEAAKRRSAAMLQEQTKTANPKPVDLVAVADFKDPLDINAAVSVPQGVDDFDKANWDDPFQVSHYAMDIFNYLKMRETSFIITDYMDKQVNLSKWMRSLLVDWMVEVQETFELNHETLYLAVKIVDLYLCRVVISKDKLQLLGAAALFIACKFDERTPPLIEDFLYICDGAYKHDELIEMEMTALKTIQFDLGIPLSYRFLRRFARCAKVHMPTLTLARYILELSLMDYDTISFSDSQMASAALFIALRLHGNAKPWTATLIHYTGYQLADFAHIVPVLIAGLHRKPKGAIKTIRSKYSHKIFHEVAKVKLMTTEQLFENNLKATTQI